MIGLQVSKITSFKTSNVIGIDMFPNISSSSKPIYVDSIQYSYPVPSTINIVNADYTFVWQSVADILDLIVNNHPLRSYKVKGLFNPTSQEVEFHRKLDQLIPINTSFFFRTRFGLIGATTLNPLYEPNLQNCYVYYEV